MFCIKNFPFSSDTVPPTYVLSGNYNATTAAPSTGLSSISTTIPVILAETVTYNPIMIVSNIINCFSNCFIYLNHFFVWFITYTYK